MTEYSNGMSAAGIAHMKWVKARASDSEGHCVEISRLPDGQVAFRNSRHPQGPALVFTRSEFGAFLEGAGAGEFARLLD